MRQTCIVCGCAIEQRTRIAKLYCSDFCCYLQLTRHIHTKEWVEEEKKRRTQAYEAELSDDERKRLMYKKKKSGVPSKIQRRHEQPAMRVCHDCGKPCNNYRCDACWKKLRHEDDGLVETVRTENEWDYF